MSKRINLWSSPRNISTALMYSFAQRSDCQVFDEPLYAYYLHHSKKNHPGLEEILKSQSTNGDQVIQETLLGTYEKEVLFFKQMTHHLIDLPDDFLMEMEHLIFIRNPQYIIHSYTKVIPDVSMEDIGIKMQVDLFNLLIKKGKKPIIVDSKNLLINPQKVLQEICKHFQIPFESSMLKWKAEARKEDGVWAKHWYANVHQSTGFKPYQAKEIQLDKKYLKLAETCLPYYNYLYEKSIIA